ncbi:cyclin-dependent kinase 2-associated protein 1 isoform 2-T2 [Rhinophrynus dorsalis]
MSLGMSYKPNLNAQLPGGNPGAQGVDKNIKDFGAKQFPRSQLGVVGASEKGIYIAGSAHSPSTSMASSAQYRQIVNDYGPPSLGYTQGSSSNQVPQSKYAELLVIIEELGKEIRPTYAGSKSAMERLKRGIIHARGLVRECLAETERNARS